MSGAVPEGQTPEHRSSPSIDEELIVTLRKIAALIRFGEYEGSETWNEPIRLGALSIECLLSDRAKLEEALRRCADLAAGVDYAGRIEDIARDALNRSTDRWRYTTSRTRPLDSSTAFPQHRPHNMSCAPCRCHADAL